MGNLFSKYWYPQPTAENSEHDCVANVSCSNSNLIEKKENEKISNGADISPPRSQAFEPASSFETPPKSAVKSRSKIFAAYVPDSPERFSFNDFNELKSFLNSPIGKRKGTRFKSCEDERDVDNFYNEQRSEINNQYPGRSIDCNESINTTTSSIEPDLPYKEIPPRQLTEFRMAIEKNELTKFEQLIEENPRFIINTSNDLPTILHIGTRCNALHIACRAGNLKAVQKILNLIRDKSWLTEAYATDVCMEERSENFLDAILNTPDKIENNTPLHLACKFSHDRIVEALLRFKICIREPVNSHNEKPLDIVGLAAKGNKQEIKEANNKILCAFRKEPCI